MNGSRGPGQAPTTTDYRAEPTTSRLDARFYPPASMGFAGRRACCFPVTRQGRAWHGYVPWERADGETLKAAASICRMGTWRRAWIDVLLDRYGHLLDLGLSLGDIAAREARP